MDTPALPTTTTSVVPSPRKAVLAERYDLALAWMASAVVGAVAISVVPEERPVVRMLTPLVIMCMYLGFALTRSRFSTGKVADSVYFMGFLWTLWALIDLLVIGGSGIAAADLYVAFGYALTATAAGMFCRLAILQFFRTIDDQEEQAVDGVDDRARKLIAELEASQVAVAGLRRIGTEELARWNREFSAEAQRHLATIAKLSIDFEAEGNGLTESVKGIRASLTLAGRGVSDVEKRLIGSFSKLTEQLSAQTATLEQKLKEVSTRVAAIEIPTDLLTREMATLLADIRGSISPVREIAHGILEQMRREVSELARALKELPRAPELEEAVKSAVAQLSAASVSCQALAGDAAKASAALAFVPDSLQKTRELLEGAASHAGGQVGDLERSLGAVSTSIQELDAGVKRVGDTVREVVSFVHKELLSYEAK